MISTASANKETVLELNGCSIEAYPSNHFDAFRSLTNLKFILLDEVDFFRKSEHEDVRHVSERYIAKSDPFIVMVSTPYAPDDLFDRIEKEPEETCIYKRILMDYTYGLDKIYTIEEIEKAKVSPSFEREYNLQYLGGIGDVFHTKDIDAAIEKGKLYDPTTSNPYSQKCMGYLKINLMRNRTNSSSSNRHNKVSIRLCCRGSKCSGRNRDN